MKTRFSRHCFYVTDVTIETLRTLYYTSFTDIYYCCQNDDGDEPFEVFCRKFLSEFSVKHLQDQQKTPRRLFLVVNLPIDNRQNTIDVLSGFITCIKRKYKLCGNYIGLLLDN